MRNRILKSVIIAAMLVLSIAVVVGATGTPAGTIITNTATLNYRDSAGNAMTKIEASVSTTVKQVGGVDVAPAAYSQVDAVSGQVFTYSFVITNTGNGTDTMALALSGVPAGYTASIYRDDNNNGVWDTGENTVVSSI